MKMISKPSDENALAQSSNFVTPKRQKRLREEDQKIQTNDKSLDEHGFDLDEEGGTYVGEVYIPPIAPVCFADPTGPRLIITKIVVLNFKSYAGFVTLGPFHKRFNAIIGPNGSGKSNVIDSMLFVFGYRASKIRANKLSVLMHKSNAVGGISRCQVAIHFAQIIDKPGDDYDIVPGSELEIARTAFYDNSSYYTLNGKKVHFKEVAKVLRNHGVDLLNNRFLILQGEVEQISMMPPKGLKEKETGLLEYLEEIIGTNRYKEPIAQMEALYAKLDEERSEKVTRAKLAENELKALQPNLLSAVGFLELENSVQRKQNEICQFEKYTNMKLVKEHEENVQKMEEEMKLDLDEVKKYREEMESAKKELKTVEKELGNKDGKVAQTDAAIEKDKIFIQKLNAELKETEKRNEKAKDELKKEESKHKKLLEVPDKNKLEIEKLEKEKEELTEEKKEIEEKIQTVSSTIQTETLTLQEEKSKLQAIQLGLKKEFNEIKSKYDIAKSELEIYLKNFSDETKKLEDTRKSLKNCQTTLDQKKNTVSELESRIPEIESQINENQVKLDDLISKEKTLIKQIDKLSVEVNEKKESMQASKSKNRIVDFVMKLKNENIVTGILGRLGDLGGIDDKYDIAISTACGPLDYIVTETVIAGEAIIAKVKENNIGRVSIIALEKMQQYYEECYSKYKTPENVPRLIDLIKVDDERIRLAFYFGCHETLVASDLNQASRIGYGSRRCRVVSLQGDIIDLSGLMSGGGRKLKGRMGRKAIVSTDTNIIQILEKQEKEKYSLEQELKITQNMKSEIQTQLNCLTNELKYKKQEYQTSLIDIKSLNLQEPELIKQIEKQELILSKIKIDSKIKSKMESNVKELEINLKKSENQVKDSDIQVENVHEQIMAISSGKTNHLNIQLDDITKKLNKIKTQITKNHAGINMNERDVNKSQGKISNLQDEIKETDTKLTNLQNKLDEHNEQLKENEQNVLQYKIELKEIQIQYGKLKKSYEQNNEQLDKVENKIKNMEKNLIEIKKEMEFAQNIVKKLNKKLETMKLHEVIEVTKSSVAEEEYIMELNVKQQEPLRQFTDEELSLRTEDQLRQELETIREQFPEEVPNLSVIQDYKLKYNEYMERVQELTETTRERNKYRKGISDTQKRRIHEFNAAFQLIADKVKETYQLLTTYGSADMSLDDNLNPFSQGINYAIRPPMKSWKFINNLSGGEKTIASLALVFALHYYKPSPLYFLDEIDAALDVRNVAIIGHYIRERTVNAQFIIISLRPECFDLADRVTGIFKVNNKSRSTSVDPKVFNVLNPYYKEYKRQEIKQQPVILSQQSQQATQQINIQSNETNIEDINKQSNNKNDENIQDNTNSQDNNKNIDNENKRKLLKRKSIELKNNENQEDDDELGIEIKKYKKNEGKENNEISNAMSEESDKDIEEEQEEKNIQRKKQKKRIIESSDDSDENEQNESDNNDYDDVNKIKTNNKNKQIKTNIIESINVNSDQSEEDDDDNKVEGSQDEDEQSDENNESITTTNNESNLTNVDKEEETTDEEENKESDENEEGDSQDTLNETSSQDTLNETSSQDTLNETSSQDTLNETSSQEEEDFKKSNKNIKNNKKNKKELLSSNENVNSNDGDFSQDDDDFINIKQIKKDQNLRKKQIIESDTESETRSTSSTRRSLRRNKN